MRIAELEAAIAAGEAVERRWASWMAALAELNQESVPSGEIFLFARSERVLYDRWLGHQLTLTSAFDDPASRERGPLVTLAGFGRQLSEAGIDFLVMPVPPRAAVYPDFIGLETPLEAGEAPPLLDHRLRRFYLELEERGVEVVDLLPSFIEHRWQDFDGPLPAGLDTYREPALRRHDNHWTTLGSRLAARRVAERVRRFPWWPDISSRLGEAVLVEWIDWREERGGIAQQMVELGTLDPATPLERFPARQVRIEGEETVTSDRASPILLIGDSFLLPQHGFPDQFLAALGFRPDVVSISGPNPSNILKALWLRGDALAGKRLVIWEMSYYSLGYWSRWEPVQVLSSPSGG